LRCTQCAFGQRPIRSSRHLAGGVPIGLWRGRRLDGMKRLAATPGGSDTLVLSITYPREEHLRQRCGRTRIPPAAWILAPSYGRVRAPHRRDGETPLPLQGNRTESTLEGRQSRRLFCLTPCLRPGCRRRSRFERFEHEKKCEEVLAAECRIALDMMRRGWGVSE
jgi:hypothetical protein